MNEAELRIEEVVIEDTLLSRLGDESRPLLAGNESEGVAGFQGAEDTDEPFFEALFANERLGPLVLLEGAGAIEIGALRLACELLGMSDEPIGPLRGKGLHEVGAADFEDVIDESFEF